MKRISIKLSFLIIFIIGLFYFINYFININQLNYNNFNKKTIYYSKKTKSITPTINDKKIFSYYIKKIENNLFEIEFFIDGNKNINQNAVDFFLNFSNLKIIDIKKGDLFKDYPLIKVENNYLKIIASMSDNNNGSFITLKVEKENDNQSSFITLDNKNSGIYFNGKNFLNDKEILYIKI